MTDMQLFAPLAGWAVPLAAVPDPVFAEGMMGQGMAIDPTGDTLHAPCDAIVLTVHAAGHAITLAVSEGVSMLMHIGIDTVAMGGAGFTPLVQPGDRVTAGSPLIRFDLDRIVRGAAAAITPVLVLDHDGVTVTERCGEGPVSVGDPLMRVRFDGVGAKVTPSTTDTAAGEIVRQDVVVQLPHGLHARPAARIVATVRGHDVRVDFRRGDAVVSAASAVALLSLGLAHGAKVTIEATGPDAAAAIAAIEPLLISEANTQVPAVAPRAVAAPVELAEGAIGGVTAAPGLAVGTGWWLRPALPDVPAHGEGVAIERTRLATGIDAVARTLAEAAATPGQMGGVLKAHQAILDDPTLIDRAVQAIDAGAAAASAILTAAVEQGAQLRASGNARIAERADDIHDVALRVVHAILGTEAAPLDVPAGAIVLAHDLLPSQLAALAGQKVGGFAVVGGGPTSHVAILAAGMGVPMLVALGEPLDAVADGTMLVIDADGGALHVDPDADRLDRAQATIASRAAAEAAARAAGDRPTVMADGTAVSVYANLGSIADARAAADAGAEGCGLLRTEFLFLDRATAPTEAEQAADYGGVAAALAGKPVVIRLLDVGGDKPAPYLDIAAEENPALGVRGIRVALAQPQILETQLRAILSVADVEHCRIMVPMVASVDEMIAVRTVLDRLRGELGIGPVQLGAMVETPAAAITADLLAAHVDFLSVGSNDLTQYVLAMDRGNPALAAGIDGLHPAVLRLIQSACRGAATRGVPVSVCGGLAADPLAVPILLGLGVRTLSVPPARVPATKALVAALSLAQATAQAEAAVAVDSAGAVRALARRFAEELAR
ncbi:phosphoenolpyruvate--protein phosphotransferase [Sphingomonas mollis]|uniref:phosphoenolpyruvate--protein phosphotransferase n=1 Tax=Sphingomonas mollis TaxID=2795726 RepID=A0ABS0XPE4_9SPHN|nr:phosphoenolpyruvate--protein phosphotransferase [Sphingomonas sp. BT553]MBJ6121877.1 phosphoenolpyruvate--protein phosphotransferase [Sphingomonas sp. BT553]